jgi:acetolactate synthase-1/2/3 large subunit
MKELAMNGAQALLATLEACGIDTCFANPGTSEMQLVAAIGASDTVRPVLCLFEGVVTGAADGYGRMADRPAATLLHLGSGFSNGMANLHNARRAGTPVVNIVGDHASYHLKYDAPLTSDLPGLADWASDWTRVADSPDSLSVLGAAAVQAAMAGSGALATLVAPANHAWEDASAAAPPLPSLPPEQVAEETVSRAAQLLSNGRRSAIYAGGRALRDSCLDTLGRIAAATGAALVCPTFPARLQRGAGRVPVQRLPYFAEQACEALAPFEQLLLIGTRAPVSFFAYPGKASWLARENCEILSLADARHDLSVALEALAAALPATEGRIPRPERVRPAVSGDRLTPQVIGQVMNRHMPAHTIVSDESATCGLGIYPEMETAEPHDWLTLTGGAIGQGLPLALGAAIASPDRKVVALQADGSAMYTVQALWSMAREAADVTVVLLNNRSYAILNIELQRVGAGTPNAKTLSMLDLSNPDMDFKALAGALGVSSSRATTASEFEMQFSEAMQIPGPRLIEVMV